MSDLHGDPGTRVREADTLREKGDLDRAARLYEVVLEQQPDNADALEGLGLLHREQGRFTEAIRELAAAANARPGAAVLSDLGFAQACGGRPEDALGTYDQALQLAPDDANVLNRRGCALCDLKQFAAALESYDRALALAPAHVSALSNRGSALIDLGRPAEGLESCEKALALNPSYAEAHVNRGAALRELGRAAEALAAFDRALAVKPGYALAAEAKGLLLVDLGRIEEGAAEIERAIAIAPGYVRAYANLAESKRLPLDSPHVSAMQSLARARLTPNEKIELHFALGTVFSQNGKHEDAFPHFLAGNALKRARTMYDEAATLGAMATLPQVFTEELLLAGRDLGCRSGLPIFIVGMPRSGTSLIEQILASYPGVFGAGETYQFSKALAAQGNAPVDPDASPEAAQAAWEESMRRLGEDYIARMTARAPAAMRIVDKTLENYRVIGLIRLALPNARIIHARRSAVDTCVSCFSRNFADLPYTYDLGELGRHYRAYEALMDHWRQVVPPDVMLDVQYEELVDDLEGHARRLLAHCDLDWDPRVLDFHLTERSVRTASVIQVRQPIYKSSIGRWRGYEPYLKPLLTELGFSPAS
jgi:tetratricopeptide (TPR) repeat protein